MNLIDIVNSSKIVPLAIGGRIADVATQFVGTEFYGKRENLNFEIIDRIGELYGSNTGMLAHEVLYVMPLIAVSYLLNQTPKRIFGMKPGNLTLFLPMLISYGAAISNLDLIFN